MTKLRNQSEWKEDSLCKHYVRKPFQVNFIWSSVHWIRWWTDEGAYKLRKTLQRLTLFFVLSLLTIGFWRLEPNLPAVFLFALWCRLSSYPFPIRVWGCCCGIVHRSKDVGVWRDFCNRNKRWSRAVLLCGALLSRVHCCSRLACPCGILL